ncbi:MAG: hypothetical protein LBK61_08575 [Spirochaetaceae bacterium]|nr:hypothetical protein [Spirochaetaceae bacterium]
MPLPGGENPQGFHLCVEPLPVLAERAAARQSEYPLMAECPAGGENPRWVFIPAWNLSPVLAERAAAWQAEHPLMAECPAGRRKPAWFSSLRGTSPRSGRKSSGMAGRAPPHGGCASPSGAQCRHKGVLCLPGTMPDWGRMNMR